MKVLPGDGVQAEVVEHGATVRTVDVPVVVAALRVEDVVRQLRLAVGEERTAVGVGWSSVVTELEVRWSCRRATAPSAL